MAFVGGLMPVERPEYMRHYTRSAHNSPIGSPIVSPSGSRRSSVSSITSAHTDPGMDVLERLRQGSVSSNQSKASQRSQTSTESATASKSGFKSLFNKSKKSKQSKDRDKIVLTSRHAATVKTKLMMQTYQQKGVSRIKTAEVVGTQRSGHLTAAAQEARHPHSGPPAIKPSLATADMPALTKIISGDERDEQDETERNLRLRLQWQESKQPTVPRVTEHEVDGNALPSAEATSDEDALDVQECIIKPFENAMQLSEGWRPSPAVTRNSYGGRFHRNEKGHWKR